MKVLRKHRAAIGYTLDDLKGISPTLCQHKINMEPGAKPVVNHQRRLNPKMKEVIRKQIIETLKKHRAAIGYTLDDLKGISPTLCQHKINLEPDAKPVVDHQ